ncbi:MAG TPA: aminomethyl-transferring glycine dehydrogenase subunit GcvPA [bacterium]|jgi:glycine dehydrogenase subunit 1|nr:aminomethyl-transferring glycine dehydrogenase subunit GcvPA [bacterium]
MPFEHPYLPQTPSDEAAMLAAIGVSSVAELFEHIPAELRLKGRLDLPDHLTEMELKDEFQSLGNANQSTGRFDNYLGAGAYEHYSPSAVRHLLSRSEFYTSYTPYQPEMTQGVLQALFEYQSCVCSLTGMDVSNASLYEGGHALAEACLMAHARTGRNRIVLSAGVHPESLQVLRTYTRNLDTEIVVAPLGADGRSDLAALKALVNDATAALVLANPNFFGVIEDGTPFAEIAHAVGALFIMAVEPVSLALLKSPGECGADIACGEGQSLGIPLSYGGPYLGFLAAKMELVRQMPGRICGQTKDNRGQRAFVLTLQTREQHIRREKANSNICTNQTLLALAATIYLGSVGPQGLKEVASQGASKAHYLAAEISKIKGVKLRYAAPWLNEFTLDLGVDAGPVLRAMQAKGILGGVALGRYYPERGREILVTVTEVKKKAKLDRYVAALREALA